ncbi:MAG: DUF268 domain-containing protein [Candidatus Thorarchaeota archaeon]
MKIIDLIMRFPPFRMIFRIFKKTKLKYNFTKEFFKFRELSSQTQSRFELSWNDRLPQLNDKTEVTQFDRHYIYHLAWAARILAKIKPKFHVDVSSSLYFSSLISSFLPVKFYDYRPPVLSLDNLTVGFADLLQLPFKNRSTMSISSMHVVEHIGLGRYGDPLDPNGDLKAINELKRVVAEKGFLLFVVPIGKAKIHFNAHRIYSYEQIMRYFSDFKLLEFALIPDSHDDGGLIYNPEPEYANSQNYGCGCFLFQRS